MYYKYKPKKRSKRILKPLAIIIVLCAIGYFTYRYREYLMFWRYSDNKLVAKLKAAENSGDKLTEFKDLAQIFDNYRESNPLNQEAYFYSARVHYGIAAANMPWSFSEFVINNLSDDMQSALPPLSLNEFQKAIRYIRKGMALGDNKKIDHEYIMIFAYSCFYASFLNMAELNEFLSLADKSELSKNVEDARFYSLVKILENEKNEGFDFLAGNGEVDSDLRGILFQSCVESMGGQYTNAIMNYRKILDTAEDPHVLKLVRMNLGKIYYKQNLYNESLEQFVAAAKNTEDVLPKIWAGKNYAALGQHDKAKVVWNEAIAVDKNNAELKKLLGI